MRDGMGPIHWAVDRLTGGIGKSDGMTEIRAVNIRPEKAKGTVILRVGGEMRLNCGRGIELACEAKRRTGRPGQRSCRPEHQRIKGP